MSVADAKSKDKKDTFLLADSATLPRNFILWLDSIHGELSACEGASALDFESNAVRITLPCTRDDLS